jgi:hypothetical protein
MLVNIVIFELKNIIRFRPDDPGEVAARSGIKKYAVLMFYIFLYNGLIVDYNTILFCDVSFNLKENHNSL